MNINDEKTKQLILRLHNNEMSYSKIAEKIGLGASAVSRFLNKKTHKDWWEENPKPFAGGRIKDHYKGVERLTGGRFLFTSVQNNTYVHPLFLKSLERCKRSLKAELIVGTCTYAKNNWRVTAETEGLWYDPGIVKYIRDEPLKVAKGLIWSGEMNISPTAVTPMSGLQSYTGDKSCIFPHPKLQLESIASPKNLPAKKMYTTGALTKINYIERKEGQKAEFQHIYSALLVEVDEDGTWFAYQLQASSETGEFQHKDVIYGPNGISRGNRVEAINWGDLHSEKRDDVCYEVSFGKKKTSMLNALKPKYQFAHDIFDFTSRNHHSIKNVYHRWAQQVSIDRVENDLDAVTRTLKEMNRDFCETVVVESNHDLALTKWLQEADYREDNIDNALFFLKCQRRVLESIRDKEKGFSIFQWCVEQQLGEGYANFLREDQSFRICNNEIECGSHGHLGANGGRPSKMTFARSGAKHNTGHTHALSIFEGAWCAGVTCSLELGYNKGYSSWSQGHIVTYPSGKRCIFEIKNGKWQVKKLRK